MDEDTDVISSQAKSQGNLEQTQRRTRTVLAPTIIKHICQVPKRKQKQVKKNSGKASKKVSPAEVHYTNSQFGQPPIPCVESGCTSCILALSQVKTKRSRSSESDDSYKPKRLCTNCLFLNKDSTMNLFMADSEISRFPRRVRHVICTEINGQLFKLVDEPREFDYVASVLDHTRKAHGRKLRVAANRNAARKTVGKKTVGQKTAGRKTVVKKTVGNRKH